jgi:hypothetical protein
MDIFDLFNSKNKNDQNRLSEITTNNEDWGEKRDGALHYYFLKMSNCQAKCRLGVHRSHLGAGKSP